MSNIKIKDLPEKIDYLQDEDLVIIEDQEDTKKISLVKLRSSFSMDGILTSIKEMLLEKINTFIINHNAQYAYLFERNRQLEVTCANLENDRLHDKDRIFELENKLVTQEDEISKLKEDNMELIISMSNLTDENNNLMGRNELLEIKLNTVEVTASQYVTNYNNLRNNYTKLQKDAKELKASVDRLQSSYITDIDGFVNEKNMELDEKLDELKRYIRYYHPDMDDLEV